jgi:hypothetical protein
MDPVPECCGPSKVFDPAAQLPIAQASASRGRALPASPPSLKKQRAENSEENPALRTPYRHLPTAATGRHQILTDVNSSGLSSLINSLVERRRCFVFEVFCWHVWHNAKQKGQNAPTNQRRDHRKPEFCWLTWKTGSLTRAAGA